MIEIVDDRGRLLRLLRPATRLVSLVPSVTETLFALGAGDTLVGATRYCVQPPAARAIPRVGGTKNPNCARIASLQPDVVLMSEEENRREDFQALEAAGLSVFVCHPRSVADVLVCVRRMGALVGRSDAADRLCAEIQAALERLAHQGRRAWRPRVFCPIWSNPWMSFNADTYAHHVLRASGADNVCAREADRYCRVDLEAIARRHVDVVLLPDEPYRFREKHVAAVRAPFEHLGKAVTVLHADGRALFWWGAGTPRGLQAVRDTLRRASPEPPKCARTPPGGRNL